MAFFSRNLHPFLQLFILLMFCLAGLLLGNVISLAVLSGVYHLSLTDLGYILGAPEEHPEARQAVVV